MRIYDVTGDAEDLRDLGRTVERAVAAARIELASAYLRRIDLDASAAHTVRTARTWQRAMRVRDTASAILLAR